MEHKKLLKRVINIAVIRALYKFTNKLIPWIVIMWAIAVSINTMVTIYFINHSI